MNLSQKIQEISEERFTVFVLGVISIVSLAIMGVEAKDIVQPIGGGLVGYLARGNKP